MKLKIKYNFLFGGTNHIDSIHKIGDKITYTLNNGPRNFEIVSKKLKNKYWKLNMEPFVATVNKFNFQGNFGWINNSLLVRQDGMNLRTFSDLLKNDFDIVLTAVRQNGMALQYASESLKNNYDIILEALKQNGLALRHVPSEKVNEQVALTAVQNNGEALETINEHYEYGIGVEVYDDELEEYAGMLQQFELNNIFEVILTAVNQIPPSALSVIPFENLNNFQLNDNQKMEIINLAIRKDGFIIFHDEIDLNPLTLNNVLTAVKQNSRVLRDLPDNFKNNRDVILEASKTVNPEIFDPIDSVLRFLQDEFKNDPEIVLNFIKNNAKEFREVSEELKNNQNFILDAVKQNGLVLQYVQNEIITENIILEAVKQNGLVLQYVQNNITENIILEAVRQNGLALQFVPQDSKTENIILEAVKQNGFALEFARNYQNLNIISEAVKSNGLALQYVPNHRRTNQIITDAFDQNILALEYMQNINLINKKDLIQRKIDNLENGSFLKSILDNKNINLENIKNRLLNYK